VKDSIAWQVMRKRLNNQHVYLLKHIDTLMKYNKLTFRSLAPALNRGVYIIPVSRKLNWFATTDTVPSTIFFVKESAMPENINKVRALVQTKFMPAFPTQNILGFMPGTQQPDSFIVLSAHYDHLGEMGRGIIFPGASDNASGVAILLSLARYYAAHPARYSIAFMAFSGEEAGLIGSGYYVVNPVFPLRQIRFLVSVDIAGDASRGITVVNAPDNKKEYALLERINREHHYLTTLTARGQAKNSDHYQFSEKGVPAVYIYTNGVKPYYHDVQDTPEELGFEKADELLLLLKDFVKYL
jgi:Zn-dependent M28 family amino/carboxypeptidase